MEVLHEIKMTNYNGARLIWKLMSINVNAHLYHIISIRKLNTKKTRPLNLVSYFQNMLT